MANLVHRASQWLFMTEISFLRDGGKRWITLLSLIIKSQMLYNTICKKFIQKHQYNKTVRIKGYNRKKKHLVPTTSVGSIMECETSLLNNLRMHHCWIEYSKSIRNSYFYSHTLDELALKAEIQTVHLGAKR